MFVVRRHGTRQRRRQRRVVVPSATSTSETPIATSESIPSDVRQFERSVADGVPSDDSIAVMLRSVSFDGSRVRSPMLARALRDKDLDAIPDLTESYFYEPKYDGERVIVIATRDEGCRCLSRNLLPLLDDIRSHIRVSLRCRECVLDCELVWLDDEERIVPICDVGFRYTKRTRLMVFDIQSCDGSSALGMTLVQRKSLLERCVIEDDKVRIVRSRGISTLENLRAVFDSAVDEHRLEGLVLKRKDERYVPGERKWLKMKPLYLRDKREEFDLSILRMIRDRNGVPSILECGYTSRATNREIVVCRVSSGLNVTTRNRLRYMCDESGVPRIPIACTLFADRVTSNGSLRHPVFVRVRDDLRGRVYDVDVDTRLLVACP